MPWYAPAPGQHPHWAYPGSYAEKSFLAQGWVQVDGTIPTPGVPPDPAAARLVKAINGKLADTTGGITLTAGDVGALDQTAGDARYHRKGAAYLSLADFLPAANPGDVDYLPYVQAALDAIGTAGGGALYIPGRINGGVIGLAGSAVPPENVRIFSDHPSAMKLVKLADAPLFDCSGQPGASTGIVSQKRNITFANITLAGAETDNTTGDPAGPDRAGGYGAGPKTTWNAPLVLTHYGQFIHFERTRFRSNYGSGVYGVRWWDSYFDNCRFDFLGKADPANPRYAVHAARQGQGSQPGDYLYADDNSNNINFHGTNVFESCRDGHIWYDGRRADGTWQSGDPQNNRFHIDVVKNECKLTMSSPMIRIDYAKVVRVRSLDFVLKDTSAALDAVVRFDGVADAVVGSVDFESTAPGTTAGYASVFKSTNARGLVLDRLSGYINASNKPTTALLNIDGTNAGVQLGPWGYLDNPGGAPLTSIGAATFEYRSVGRGMRVHNLLAPAALGATVNHVEVTDITGAVVGRVEVKPLAPPP